MPGIVAGGIIAGGAAVASTSVEADVAEAVLYDWEKTDFYAKDKQVCHLLQHNAVYCQTLQHNTPRDTVTSPTYVKDKDVCHVCVCDVCVWDVCVYDVCVCDVTVALRDVLLFMLDPTVFLCVTVSTCDVTHLRVA